LPVRVLSSVFRGKFLDLTRRAFANRKLQFQGAVGVKVVVARTVIIMQPPSS
jgi:hypothetical protein